MGRQEPHAPGKPLFPKDDQALVRSLLWSRPWPARSQALLASTMVSRGYAGRPSLLRHSTHAYLAVDAQERSISPGSWTASGKRRVGQCRLQNRARPRSLRLRTLMFRYRSKRPARLPALPTIEGSRSCHDRSARGIHGTRSATTTTVARFCFIRFLALTGARAVIETSTSRSMFPVRCARPCPTGCCVDFPPDEGDPEQ